MIKFIHKNKKVILYLLFGVMTTAINIIAYNLCYYCFNISNNISNIVAWILSVLFAYITNKKWVFESQIFNFRIVVKELFSFLGCRFITGLLDIVIMYISVDILKLTPWIFKIISNLIVIILNYIASKLIVFRK